MSTSRKEGKGDGGAAPSAAPLGRAETFPIGFLDLAPAFSQRNTAASALLLVPYEGGVSQAGGAAQGPEAILRASPSLEVYDLSLGMEPYRMGIFSGLATPLGPTPAETLPAVHEAAGELLDEGKFVLLLGGDHSVTPPFFRAISERFGQVGVIQLDAHADLRESYQGSHFNHACTMARIRELTPHTLQIGIRSMCREEADRIQREDLAVVTMEHFRSREFRLESALHKLPRRVFVTLDVDALDWSVVWSTGTPEPGGFDWREITRLLQEIFLRKEVVGCDVVELAPRPGDPNSPLAVAKLVYRILGLKLSSRAMRKGFPPPQAPAGPILMDV